MVRLEFLGSAWAIVISFIGAHARGGACGGGRCPHDGELGVPLDLPPLGEINVRAGSDDGSWLAICRPLPSTPPAQSATIHKVFSGARMMCGWIDGIEKSGGRRGETCLPCSSVTSVVNIYIWFTRHVGGTSGTTNGTDNDRGCRC
ncbi:hypothetical protein K466DRAFT_404956 [Polyporus arcularius HHB13444]|uniref:Secreted protein n=1 Tax=Polyporus arcularius HHB13444 TaxID=1314778 RepID=A0A5C3PL66_9APHY|nr:hypothetical protein K466DRAFT_404956 [Polyporus arcularius HHB13444]